MSDSAWANIEIGGRLPKRLLPDFMDALKNNFNDDVKLDDFIRKGDGVLEFEDVEARNGEFRELEIFCHNHNLSFIRERASCGGDQAVLVWWEPGMTDAFYRYLDENGGRITQDANIESMLESIDKALKILKGDPERAVLIMNSKDNTQKEFAKHILNEGKVDPYKFFKEFFKSNNEELETVPKFEII